RRPPPRPTPFPYTTLFRSVLPRDVPPAVQKRFYRIAWLGVFGVVEVGIVAFVLRAEDALQLPFGKLLYGDLTPMANGTRFGIARSEEHTSELQSPYDLVCR